jgi:predicted HicB family RNase H-like nuclease
VRCREGGPGCVAGRAGRGALSERVVTMTAMNNYTYRAEWCAETGTYLGRCLEFPLTSARAPTAREAIRLVELDVAELVAEYSEEGAAAPPSLSDRGYSGKFMVRTSPQLHAKLTIEASEQGVSLNHWVVQKLASRPQTLDEFF